VLNRLHEPGEIATAQIGRMFAIHYRVPTTLAHERRIAADFLDHCHATGDRGVILSINDAPLLPLPPLEVRAHWRKFLAETDRVVAVAAVARGLVGVAGAAMTNLLEHVVDPAFGVPLRVFTEPRGAVAWLASFIELGISEAECLEQLEQLRRQP
jgi:hypothetical protein